MYIIYQCNFDESTQMNYYLNLFVGNVVNLFLLFCTTFSNISIQFTLGIRLMTSNFLNSVTHLNQYKENMEINRNRKSENLSQMEIMEAESS